MSEENLKIEKIRKSSKIALIVTRITNIVAIAGAVACILGGSAIYWFRDIINTGLMSGITSEAIQESYSPFQPEIIKNLKIVLVLITVMEVKFSPLIGLLIGLASWCVVCIFEYGCELQRQSDETL